MTPENSILLNQERLCGTANQEHFGLHHAVFFHDLSVERNHLKLMSFRCYQTIYIISTFFTFLGDETAQENGTADSLSFHPDLSLGWNPPTQRSPASSATTGQWHQSLPSQRGSLNDLISWLAESCRAGTWQWPFYIFWEVPELVAFSCSGQVARKLRSAQHGGADLRDWDPITSGSVTDSKGPKIKVHRGNLNHPNLDHSEF